MPRTKLFKNLAHNITHFIGKGDIRAARKELSRAGEELNEEEFMLLHNTIEGFERCKTCGGTGEVEHLEFDNSIMMRCPHCNLDKDLA